MKRINYLLFLLLLSAFSSYGQEFSFILRFEDAVGNKDSLLLGYDSNATNGLDPEFGEIDLHYTPFDPEFEVRITKYWEFSYMNDTLLLKKQIIRKTCNEKIYPLIQEILVKCKHYPLTVSWNPVFNDQCVAKTFLIWVAAIPNHTNYRGDQLDAVYFVLSSTNQFKEEIAGNPSVSDLSVKIYPNPADDMLYIDSVDDIASISVKNIAGQSMLTASSSPLDISSLSGGMYFIEIQSKIRQVPVVLKLLKK